MYLKVEKRVSSEKIILLGVNIDCNLTFKSQITNLCTSAKANLKPYREVENISL